MAISPAALEESLLCLLCFSKEQAQLVALKIQDFRLFTNRTNQMIAQAALNYITKFRTCPGMQLEYILEMELKRGEEGKLLGQTIDLLAKQSQYVQADFVLGELDHFLETQKLSKSLQEALEHLQQGDLEKARESMFKPTIPSMNGSSGIWLKDPRDALKFLERDEDKEFFSSGIDTLDQRGVRPERKTLTVIIASSGRGKSWALVNVGKVGLQHHHKVLHITLEISEEKTARRYIQSIFSLTREQEQEIKVQCFYKDEHGNTAFTPSQITRDSIPSKRKDIEKRLREMQSYPDLVIKEYPTSMLAVESLPLYMDTLERERGFRPDILLIDYADLMKIDAQSLRIDTGRLYRDLRGLAVSRNLALVTATQGNRDSESAKLVTSTNVSEDWSKIGTADTVLTYSQTSLEKGLGLARIFVAKSRDSSDRFITLITQSYEVGAFCLDSVIMESNLYEQIKQSEEKGG